MRLPLVPTALLGLVALSQPAAAAPVTGSEARAGLVVSLLSESGTGQEEVAMPDSLQTIARTELARDDGQAFGGEIVLLDPGIPIGTPLLDIGAEAFAEVPGFGGALIDIAVTQVMEFRNTTSAFPIHFDIAVEASARATSTLGFGIGLLGGSTGIAEAIFEEIGLGTVESAIVIASNGSGSGTLTPPVRTLRIDVAAGATRSFRASIRAGAAASRFPAVAAEPPLLPAETAGFPLTPILLAGDPARVPLPAGIGPLALVLGLMAAAAARRRLDLRARDARITA